MEVTRDRKRGGEEALWIPLFHFQPENTIFDTVDPRSWTCADKGSSPDALLQSEGVLFRLLLSFWALCIVIPMCLVHDL